MFRGEHGLWKNHQPAELATPEAFERDPALVWEWYDWRRQQIAACTPNRAHAVLAEWSRRDPTFTLVTQNVDGLHLRELPDADVCCGFGGTFCVKSPDISNRMVETKIEQVIETGADTLLAGDLGCLMNMAGKLQRQGVRVRVRHVAEVLAGMGDKPAIGEPRVD